MLQLCLFEKQNAVYPQKTFRNISSGTNDDRIGKKAREKHSLTVPMIYLPKI